MPRCLWAVVRYVDINNCTSHHMWMWIVSFDCAQFLYCVRYWSEKLAGSWRENDWWTPHYFAPFFMFHGIREAETKDWKGKPLAKICNGHTPIASREFLSAIGNNTRCFVFYLNQSFIYLCSHQLAPCHGFFRCVNCGSFKYFPWPNGSN